MGNVCAPIDVVARYLEDPGLRTDDDLTWLQYIEQRAYASPHGRGTPGTGADPSLPAIYNPYDYSVPSDHPKDMKDGPPFSQRYDEMGAEYGVTHPPELYLDPEEAIYKDWYKVREQDFTTDPSEQQPAISQDRRYASMGVEASTLSQIISADHHYRRPQKESRAGAVTVALMDSEEKAMLKGLFRFRCQSRTSTEFRTVTMQFLRPKGRARPKSYTDYPVQLSCTCPSFLFYGAQYYAVHGKYMWMPGFRPSLVPPIPQTMVSSVRNGKRHPGRGLNFKACKHVFACYDWIQRRGLRIVFHYRRYPQIGPPAKIMNPKQWLLFFGFPFTLEEIKRRLSGRRLALPRFFSTTRFRRRQHSAELEQWFRDTWLTRTEPEKLNVLETLEEHPEEIFYILVKDAMEAPTRISPAGIEKAYEMMSKVVQPENLQEPEGPEPTDEGTGIAVPKEPAGKPGEAPGKPEEPGIKTVKGVEPAIGKTAPEAPGSPSSEPLQNDTM